MDKPVTLTESLRSYRKLFADLKEFDRYPSPRLLEVMFQKMEEAADEIELLQELSQAES